MLGSQSPRTTKLCFKQINFRRGERSPLNLRAVNVRHYLDQALAKLFYQSGWTQEEFAKTASFSNRGKCPWSCGRAARSLG
jgi:hypothetical protein